MDFGQTPDCTTPLLVVKRTVDPSERNPLRFHLEDFPIGGGVYVVRFANRTVQRLAGESSVLRIGHSGDFRQRFNNYGSTDVLGELNLSLGEVLGGKRKDAANIVVVHALIRFLSPPNQEDILVDFYSKASEQDFLLRYVDRHLETPPLNFSLKGHA